MEHHRSPTADLLSKLPCRSKDKAKKSDAKLRESRFLKTQVECQSRRSILYFKRSGKKRSLTESRKVVSQPKDFLITRGRVSPESGSQVHLLIHSIGWGAENTVGQLFSKNPLTKLKCAHRIVG